MNDNPYTSNPPVYLSKSIRVYRIYVTLILFSILFSVFVSPALGNSGNTMRDIAELIVGLPVLSLFLLAPLGLYYSLRSHRNKEGNRRRLVLYTIGHAFFCLFIILVSFVFVADLMTLFDW